MVLTYLLDSLFLTYLLDSLFWLSFLAVLASIGIITLIYRRHSLKKFELLVWGVLLVLCAALSMLGFQSTIQTIDNWIPNLKNDQLGLVISIKVILSIFQYIIPLTIAAIGSFFIAISVDSDLVVH